MFTKIFKTLIAVFFCMIQLLTVCAADSEMAKRYDHFIYPAIIPAAIRKHIEADRVSFLTELQRVLTQEQENLLILVDKNHFLPEGYIPPQLIKLTGDRAYRINRKDLSLTKTAEQALQQMALAAKQDGITLLVSSSYRPYAYQKTLFERYVREAGEKEAERFSARPGTSQHQLGTVIDFGSITDEFAQTRAGKWMLQNAAKYGWSLSFPKGYESVTGYVWESWHYLYIGTGACAFQQRWFNDIQQYMLEFIDAWKKQNR